MSNNLTQGQIEELIKQQLPRRSVFGSLATSNKIEEIILFPTDPNKKYAAIVITEGKERIMIKVNLYYAVRLVDYKIISDRLEVISVKRFPVKNNLIKNKGYLTLGDAYKGVEEVLSEMNEMRNNYTAFEESLQRYFRKRQLRKLNESLTSNEIRISSLQNGYQQVKLELKKANAIIFALQEKNKELSGIKGTDDASSDNNKEVFLDNSKEWNRDNLKSQFIEENSKQKEVNNNMDKVIKRLKNENTELKTKADNWGKLEEKFGNISDIVEKLQKLDVLESSVTTLTNNLDDVKNKLKSKEEYNNELLEKLQKLGEIESFLKGKCNGISTVKDDNSLNITEEEKRELEKEFGEYETQIQVIDKVRNGLK